MFVDVTLEMHVRIMTIKHITFDADPSSKPDQHWKYQEWHELDGYPYWATHATYSGGGYEAQFGK